jgi:hypothetical protein
MLLSRRTIREAQRSGRFARRPALNTCAAPYDEGADCEVQVELRVDVGEAVARDLSDSAQPVAQRVAVA